MNFFNNSSISFKIPFYLDIKFSIKFLSLSPNKFSFKLLFLYSLYNLSIITSKSSLNFSLLISITEFIIFIIVRITSLINNFFFYSFDLFETRELCSYRYPS